MKKVLVLLSLLTALAVTAGDNSNLSVEAGYNSQYIVNGVARSKVCGCIFGRYSFG
jgi:hypothetical protein